eukprot:XP_001696715.1 predicted protein [Chlamydomonas reinhardtii]
MPAVLAPLPAAGVKPAGYGASFRLRPAVLAPFPAAVWCQARRAWSWLQLLWRCNQVTAHRARALSRGWMVSSPQVSYWREDCSQAGWMVERARTYATMLAHGVHDGAA